MKSRDLELDGAAQALLTLTSDAVLVVLSSSPQSTSDLARQCEILSTTFEGVTVMAILPKNGIHPAACIWLPRGATYQRALSL